MIHLLWPTIRPHKMLQTHKIWINNSFHPDRIITYVAVNTQDDWEYIAQNVRSDLAVNVYVSGDKPGVVRACNYLTGLKQLYGPDDDIVILSSDDMYAPENWDCWLDSVMVKKDVAIFINDGYIKQSNVTLPIMTMGCFKKLNRIIYHPAYTHSYSDTELYYNLVSLNMLQDMWAESPIFEHKNWANKKREFDVVDRQIMRAVKQDAKMWSIRQHYQVTDRLTTL